MGQQQEEKSRAAEKQLTVIFDEAIRMGVAKRR